ncbi:unnamed protein product [Bursaphelenchus okinawaensis]|uniref:Uncharacterized protein n=1 Tax=Bursaphelenchus okinawaensis TaxID=465554 RepID=A0A811KSX9_9BILA|nr:unnamed protein product [Bursaphelenchus okinawaensis]CAG9112410.1 unnamed protein product [Bursaphelenchus okinawaensis]
MDSAVSQSEASSQGSLCSPQTRYIVSLCVISTVGISTLVIQKLGPCLILSAPVGLLLVCFTYQWVQLYSSSLTRTRRAFFDEANILDTYQTRARTHGHLFQPDPPTPVPGSSDSSDKQMSKSEFERMRDEHYTDMFNKADRQAKEKLTAPKFAKAEEPIHIEFKEPPEPDDGSDKDAGG